MFKRIIRIVYNKTSLQDVFIVFSIELYTEFATRHGLDFPNHLEVSEILVPACYNMDK